MIPIDEALRLIDANVKVKEPDEIDLSRVVGRTLASDVFADVNSPPHDRSVMDGFAIRSTDLNGGTSSFKVVETIIAGATPKLALGPGETSQVMTGAPIPENCDAVIMVEKASVTTDPDGSATATFQVDEISAEKHVLRRGVNFRRGQSVFSKGHVIRATDVGLLAEVGMARVKVGGTPKVAVLPTGNELVSADEVPQAGQIRNSNGPMLLAMLRSRGLEATDLGIGRDDPGELEALIKQGLSHDILVLSGGVSAGKMDLVPGALERLGVGQIFHKVCVKPGKPIWFGKLSSGDRQTIVFGLPGNPVSSLVGFHLFVRAAIRKMEVGDIGSARKLSAELTMDHETRGNRPTYWPGKLKPDSSTVRLVEPLVWRGSSDMMALGEADGLIRFDASSTIHHAGAQVDFLPF